MPTRPLALAHINERNRQFWKKQNNLRDTRIADAAIFQTAMQDLESEEVRQIPVYFRKSLEKALEDGARTKRWCDEQSKGQFQTEFSRKGGRASKTDALQRWIVEVVRSAPDINTERLLQMIQRLAKTDHPLDIEVDHKSNLLCDQVEQIHFDNNGKSKTARVSGLKDRLSRAKKEILSR